MTVPGIRPRKEFRGNEPTYFKEVAGKWPEMTLDDFKILQLSWIYDLNFNASLKLLLKRDYIHRIVKTLPETKEIGRVSDFLREYVDQRLRESSDKK